MKPKEKMSFKRVLAIILGVVLVIFMFVILGGYTNAGDTKGSLLWVIFMMGTLAIALLYFGIKGGKEPQVGFIPEKKTKPEDQEK